MSDKSRGQKIAESHRKNKEVRDFLANLNSVQVNNFVRKLDARTIKRLRKGLENYDSKAAIVRRSQLEKEIKKLQAELAEIN